MVRKEAVRRKAAELGFPLCGFAPVGPPEHADFVRHWLARGNAAGMTYIERGLAKRLDPSIVLAGARSIVTVAYPYAPPPPPPGDWRIELRGRIASYALGPDYHDVVLAKIEALALAIGLLEPGCRTLPYVDTGPILEHEWARAGGLGWFGKNTLILHRAHGSWFFLADVLTDIEFEPEPLAPDHCGTCRRCIDGCPTGALRGSYELDARLCLSYLTIEHRGPIAAELRQQMGNWIFGCDICQEVCPWNSNAAGPAARADELNPALPDLLRLTGAEFRARYRTTALWRAKRAGLLRNVTIALGNSGNPEALPPLIAALRDDPSPLVRGHAAWAISALPNAARGREALERAGGDPDEFVRDEARLGLGGGA